MQSASHSDRFIPTKAVIRTHWMRGWVGLTVGIVPVALGIIPVFACNRAPDIKTAVNSFLTLQDNQHVYRYEYISFHGDHALVNSVALVRQRTIPTVRPPLVGEVGANFSG
jgi:hypothetical protein